ncbi:huntingtin-like [Oppia nitens]|uniref:huntingtin-like n=1 Tax=Oppia nitens TaxID=1686743 RepID=UPI0023DC2E9E|nr:huntingtin-like [Oppia nitens]
MASIEKLVKAFEALKVIQTVADKPEEALVSTRFIKRETSLTKKDKAFHCNTIADIICCPSLRNIEDFHKFLGIAIETFLVCCDDPDSDVRMTSNECLNRTIKNLMDSQLGRIQVELYKEIKKNGSTRSLRVALSRFADLSHLTRSAKCRPYVQNLFPSLIKISERTDEDLIQDTLQMAIIKIMPTLAPFATDNEIICLLNAFLPNLQYVTPSVRRTAASSLVVICQYSRKPQIFFSWLLTHLLKSLNQMNVISETTDDSSMDTQTNERLLVGIFVCLKYMIPHLYDMPSHVEYESLKTFGVSQKQRELMAKDYDTITENLLQMFELILHNIRYNNNNSVIVSALEALLQLMKTPPKMILPYLYDSKGIDKSRIGSYIHSSPASPMLSLHRFKSRLQSHNSLSCSSINVNSLDDDEMINICGITSLDDKLVQSLENIPQNAVTSQQQQITRSMDNLSISDTIGLTESDNNEPNLNVVNETNVGVDYDLNTLKQNRHSSMSFQMTKLTYFDSEDINDVPISPSNTDGSFDAIDDRLNYGDIGDFTSENINCLEYSIRLICSQFLLTGTTGRLVSDKKVRVSVKSLALANVSAIVRLQPKILLIEMFIERVESPNKIADSSQKIWDIFQYSTHTDPQIRGQIAIIIGHFINGVLNESNSFNDYLLQNCTVSSFSEFPTLEDLLSKLSSLILDDNDSSIAVKHGLTGLKNCINNCLESNDNINLCAYLLLDQLIPVKDNPYWLIKAELVDLFAHIDYKIIHFIELSKSQFKNGIVVKRKSLQNRILNDVILSLLADEDFRVREASANALCNLIPVLFAPCVYSDNDPITAIALEHTNKNLSQNENLFKDYDSMVPPIKAFIDPLNTEYLKIYPNNRLIESNLLDVVKKLLNKLLFNLDERYALIGCCNALTLLSDKYPVTDYPECWGTDLTESSVGIQLLDICITLLLTNPLIMLDLNAHQSIISFTGNIIEGLAYNAIKSNIKVNNSSTCELDWGLISHVSPHLAQQSETFFVHLLRILNIYSLVIDEPITTTNIMSSLTNYNKVPVIQSLSNSPLSPMRKKSSIKSSDLSDKIDLMKKSDSEKSDKDRLLKFGSNPLYSRFNDLIRASYMSNKTSMDLSSDKMSGLLNIVLNVLGRLLEMTTIKFISKYVEEVLHYLKIVFTLEHSLTVKTVRQLLKCIFGTNFVIMFTNTNADNSHVINKCDKEVPNDDNSTPQRMPFSNGIPNYSEVDGLYNTCLSSPYTKFTKFYATMSAKVLSNFGSSDETDFSFGCWLRKKVEKRVSLILDKNISNSGLNSKTSLTSHIRLFEPVVIKALKQYTITSDIELQCEVLDLLSQLVQLRVNYCLLDSEQIFIGFVLKQFEFIESVHLDQYDKLIGHIFYFLILLSYEKYHSKPIIGIPKIIQLCDGILASGQYPQKFALPSLEPIVVDLILLRNASKVESAKELEAQREVIVANCLKLVQFSDILQILIIIIKQSKKDGEEKWKKISRQIIDTLLPQLVKQSIHIDSYKSLDLLHKLFECVSPNVFRPLDILLKALFAAPQPDIIDNYYYFHRWTSLILVILRLIIVQAKEDVVLARLEDMKSSIVSIGPFGLPVIPTSSLANSIPFHMSSVNINRSDTQTLEAEDMFAEYLLEIIELCSHEITIRMNTIYSDIQRHCDFLIQQMANYMLILTHMFQSGSFRRVAKAAMNLIKKCQFSDCVDTDDTNSYLNGFSLYKTNSSFLTLMSSHPTLSLQWFNLLMLLNYEDNNEDGLWNQLIRPNHNSLNISNSKLQAIGKRRGSVNKMKNMFVFSPSVEIIRRGSLILFCDFVCENMNDAEHMTWLIVQNINEIIKLCHELPVSEFICAIHRNSASSGLFIQAINARCDENLRIGSFCRRLLHCLGRVHPTQSLSLITYLIEKLISNPGLNFNCLLMSEAETLVIKRLKSMSSSLESYSNQSSNQLTAQDLDKLVHSLNTKQHSQLISILNSFRKDISDTNSVQTTHPLFDNMNASEIPEINKEWFLTVLMRYCQRYSKGHKTAHLINKLSYDDIVSIMSSKDFALEILGECIEFGDQFIEEDDKSNTKIMFSAVMNRINLLKASLNSVLQHSSYFINILPAPHYPFLPHLEMSTPKEARHRDKLIEFFGQSDIWSYLFRLSNGFLAFMDHHSERSIATDLLANIARITTLYAEALQYMTEAIECVSFTYIIVVLKIMKSALNCNSIFTYLSTSKTVSYQCSIISALHSFTQHFFGELPKLEGPKSFGKSEKENPEWKHPHRTCIRMAQLVCCLETHQYKSTSVPQSICSLLRKVIFLTARLPLVNGFVMVPIAVWNFDGESTWNPNFSGDFGTIIPTIPSEYLNFRDVLDQFCFRVMNLGLTSRIQFEEIWMTLLGVLNTNSQLDDHSEDQSERTNICLYVTKAITQLLLLSTLSPQPGNPIKSKFIKQKNEKMSTFLHSTHGSKLQAVRESLLSAINSLLTNNDENQYNFYGFGQISVQLLRHSIKTTTFNELSPSLSSTSSSSDYSPLSPINTSNLSKNIVTNQEKLEIDLNSCLHFLLDLFGQLLTAQQPMQLPLLTEICRSTILLSDLFTERMQFEWLLSTFLELHRMAQISEDEIMCQYLIVGICKASAVLGVDTEAIIDKCKKSIEISLKSHYLPTRIATIHGLKYLLEFQGIGSNNKETQYLSIASDYILKHLSDNTLPSSFNAEHVENMWKLSFHLIEYFVEDFAENEFAQKIFQLSLKVITDKTSKVYPIVVNGLDNLILNEKFSIKESNLIIKSSLERFKTSSTQLDALLALQLTMSATYFVGSVGLDLDKTMDDSEEFLLAMEKLSVIFERLKTCHAYEAQQICNVLPHFLCEFFPTQDILNKCIGEFLSGQQTHAKHLANILFVVFNKLQNDSHLNIVHDWVILSLSSFTQLSPLNSAIWSLNSFLICASVNPWIRCAFAYIQTRYGLLEDIDRQLFFLVCYNFYNELKTEQNREAFRKTFQSVAELPDSPYSQVLRYLQISRN